MSKDTTCVIALFYNSKLLILQRGKTAPWMPNKWSLVGGLVDDEDEVETIKRETIEEIGLSPKDIKFVHEIETPDVGRIVYFVGHLDSDKIILDYENQAYKFITLNEVHEFNFVPYIVDEFIKTLSYGI